MYYTGYFASLGSSHFTSVYPRGSIVALLDLLAFGDYPECSVQSCIKMGRETISGGENESVIQKNIFLGAGSLIIKDRLRKVESVHQLRWTYLRGKQIDWSVQEIAKELRLFADDFETEFIKAEEQCNKACCSCLLGIFKFFIDIAYRLARVIG